MNKRSREILSRLLAKAEYQQEITIDELTSLYGVSSRTIRYDLDQINGFLASKQIEKIALGKNGILLPKEDFMKCKEYILDEEFYTFKLSKAEREAFVAMMLLCARDFLTLSEMADNLMISRSTLIQDVERLKEKVKPYKLSLQSYPNKGLLMQGMELDKRKFIIHLIRSQKTLFKDGPLFYHLLDIVEKKSGKIIEKEMIEKIINEAEQVFGLFLTDTDFHYLKFYLMIALHRISMGYSIEHLADENENTERMALGILKQIDIFTNIVFTPGEVSFLSNYLGELRYLKKERKNKEMVKIQVIAGLFIKKISDELGIDLKKDYLFYENLSNHLESTFSQACKNMDLNSITQEVLTKYPQVVEAVKNSKSILENYIDRELNDTELAYIVVHICAAIERNVNSKNQYRAILVCNGGIGTSQLLQERLKKYFNFHVIDIVSAHGMLGKPLDDVDLVISTVSLSHINVKHIQVSPMLNDKDCIRIGNYLSTIQGHEAVDEEEEKKKKLISKIEMYIDDYENKEEMKKQISRELRRFLHMEEEVRLSDLLTEETICMDVICKDWEEAVRASGKYLLENNYIEKRYIDAMIKNMRENGPYVVLAPGFAFPHEATDAGVNKLGMSLIKLSNPIEFGHAAYDPIQWVCCLCTTDKEKHLKAMFHLINLLHNDVFRYELDEAKSPSEIADIMKSYEK